LSKPYVLNRCRRATTCPPIGCVAPLSASSDVGASNHGCSNAARAVMRVSGSRSSIFRTRSTHSGLSRGHGSATKSI